MLRATRSLPCILAACQTIGTFYSSTSLCCHGWFFWFGLCSRAVFADHTPACCLRGHCLISASAAIQKGPRSDTWLAGLLLQVGLGRSPACMCQRRASSGGSPCAQPRWAQPGRRGREEPGLRGLIPASPEGCCRQRHPFHRIKLADPLPCPPGIVIQTLRHGKLMIYRSPQPTQTDTRDL